MNPEIVSTWFVASFDALCIKGDHEITSGDIVREVDTDEYECRHCVELGVS